MAFQAHVRKMEQRENCYFLLWFVFQYALLHLGHLGNWESPGFAQVAVFMLDPIKSWQRQTKKCQFFFLILGGAVMGS